MCGIYFTNKLEIPINKIQTELSKRGNDAFNTSYEGNYFFSQALLARTDTINNSQQPLRVDNLTLLFSGEIYNHLDIRKKLNYTFKTLTDSETLIVGFKQLGSKIFDLIEGMYAIIIFDKEKNTLHVLRDSFGIKPLYYTNHNTLTFSSSLSLLKTEKIEKNAFLDYKYYGWLIGYKTIFKNVYAFPKGEYWKVNCNNNKIKKKKITNTIPENNSLKHLISTSFCNQSKASLKQGILFSGGIDSSLLAVISKNLKLNIPLYTFDFKGNQSKYGFSDDLTYAKKIAKELKLELRVVSYTDKDFINYKDNVLPYLNEPYLDLAGFSLHQICKEAKKDGIKILHNGLGPDEFFAGYRRHHFIKKIGSNLIIRRLPFLQKIIFNLIISRKKRVSPITSQYFKGSSFLEKSLNFDRNEYLTNNNLNYSEAIGLLHGIETRFPFLTSEIESLCHTKASNNWYNKKQLKEILSDYLPDEFISRAKSGFALPSDSFNLNTTKFRKRVLKNWLKN